MTVEPRRDLARSQGFVEADDVPVAADSHVDGPLAGTRSAAVVGIRLTGTQRVLAKSLCTVVLPVQRRRGSAIHDVQISRGSVIEVGALTTRSPGRD